MIKLPNKFLENMQGLLGKEYSDFVEILMNGIGFRGIRRNPLKCTENEFLKICPYPVRKTPFSDLEFQIDENTKSIGKHPLHHAGAYYSQEPSASAVVTVLNPQPDEKILDLCAAPGGKSTQIAGILSGTGLLWANEIVFSRAKILLSNIERLGVSNAIITSNHPEQLCSKLVGYFDRILVDAPCSGEGMFLADRGAVEEWSDEHVDSCSKRQINILSSAAKALKPGGTLVYSTCTFEKRENEDTVSFFLREHPEFSLINIEADFGRPSPYLPFTRRIYPMDGGNGHFIAKMIKNDGKEFSDREFFSNYLSDRKTLSEIEKFKSEIEADNNQEWHYILHNQQIYQIQPDIPNFEGIKALRIGTQIAEIRRNRLDPLHHYFMSLTPARMKKFLSLSSSEEQILHFLHGEELTVEGFDKGYLPVCVDGISVGFGKLVQRQLKNHYPKGLRTLS